MSPGEMMHFRVYYGGVYYGREYYSRKYYGGMNIKAGYIMGGYISAGYIMVRYITTSYKTAGYIVASWKRKQPYLDECKTITIFDYCVRKLSVRSTTYIPLALSKHIGKLTKQLYVYISVYIHTYTHIYIYIYISATTLCAFAVTGLVSFAFRLLLSDWISGFLLNTHTP